MTEKEYLKQLERIAKHMERIQEIINIIDTSDNWAIPATVSIEDNGVYLISSDSFHNKNLVDWKMPLASEPYERKQARGREFRINDIRFFDLHAEDVQNKEEI